MRILLQPDPYSVSPVYQEQPSLWHHMSDALRASVDRVSSLLVLILPGLLAFLFALALLALLGVLLSWVVRKVLVGLRFDDRMARQQANGSSVADFSPGHSPTALAGRIVFWACVFLGLVIGISAFSAAYGAGGSALTLSLLPYLTHSVGAILLLFAGTIMARYLARTVLISAVNAQLQYARFLSLGVKWLVLVFTAAMVLEHLQIGSGIVELAFGILFGGIVLTLALAIGLGSRDLVSRSLERQSDRMERSNTPVPVQNPQQTGTLRHF